MPRLTELRVFDNTFDADPHAGRAPQPILILHSAKGKIREMAELSKTPQWAKALVAAAPKISVIDSVGLAQGVLVEEWR